MRVGTITVVVVTLLGACQAEPSPAVVAGTPPATVSSAPMAPSGAAASTAAPRAAANPTSRPTEIAVTPPFTSDAYDTAVIDDAIERFATGLTAQYDGADPAAMQRWFTEAGLRSAIAFDWRLRGSVRKQTALRGEFSVLGYSTTHEDGLASPPILATDIGFMVAPGASLADPDTGVVVQTWSEPQRFAINVELLYDASIAGWRANRVGPATDPLRWAAPPPRIPTRCRGLGPKLPDRADPAAERPWCLGGADGQAMSTNEVILFARVPCGETRASVLTVGWPVGSPIDFADIHQYVRDPDGGFDARWPLATDYDGDAPRPADAYTTTLTDGEFELWVSPKADGSAIWMRHGDRFERWPRAGAWGVTDCN